MHPSSVEHSLGTADTLLSTWVGPTYLYGVNLPVADCVAPKLICQLSMQRIAAPAGTAQHNVAQSDAH